MNPTVYIEIKSSELWVFNTKVPSSVCVGRSRYPLLGTFNLRINALFFSVNPAGYNYPPGERMKIKLICRLKIDRDQALISISTKQEF